MRDVDPDLADLCGRSGLLPGTEKDSLEEVARSLHGIHASRPFSPHPIAAARIRSSDSLSAFREEPVTSGLLRVRCVRKTLYLLPIDQAAVAHCASLRYRERDALTQLTKHVDPRDFARHAAALSEWLSCGWTSRAALEAHFSANPVISVKAWRLVLKLCWERGHVICRNVSARWGGEDRQYMLGESHFGSDRLNVHDPSDAVVQLVSAYVSTFGPVTLRDIAWWAALSGRDVATAVSSIGLQSWTVKWAPSPVVGFEWQRTARHPELAEPWLKLLGHEDSLLKGYKETRSRFVADSNYGRLYNVIAEALPAIMVNGRVVGTWNWAGPLPVPQWFPNERTPDRSRLFNVQAESLAGRLA